MDRTGGQVSWAAYSCKLFTYAHTQILDYPNPVHTEVILNTVQTCLSL